MNERIRQLAADTRGQMVVLTAVDDEEWKRHEEFVEEFARLIVRECANTLVKWKDEPFPYDPEFGARLIKQHFGVEVC